MSQDLHQTPEQVARHRTVSSLAARLSRLDQQLEPEAQHKIASEAGKPLTAIVRDLFDAIDPDQVEADAKAAGHPEPDAAALQNAREERIRRAAHVFTGPLIHLMDSIRRDHEQTIDHDSLDQLLTAGWAGDTTENARQIAQDFADYLHEHRDRIEALTIYFNTPARRSAVTDAADVLEADIDAALTRADALRQSILKKAFSGQLVPQDPDDEPASVLLDRIKAGRTTSSKPRRTRKSTA